MMYIFEYYLLWLLETYVTISIFANIVTTVVNACDNVTRMLMFLDLLMQTSQVLLPGHICSVSMTSEVSCCLWLGWQQICSERQYCTRDSIIYKICSDIIVQETALYTKSAQRDIIVQETALYTKSAQSDSIVQNLLRKTALFKICSKWHHCTKCTRQKQ